IRSYGGRAILKRLLEGNSRSGRGAHCSRTADAERPRSIWWPRTEPRLNATGRTCLRRLAFTASDAYCFLSNTTGPSTYHAIDSVSGGMSRMGRTSATALFVLAIATLTLVPHVSASVTVRDLGTLPGYTLSEGFG